MELFLIFCVILATIFIFRSFIANRLIKSSNTKAKLPPGSTGWPIIGESVAFASHPEKFTHERMTKHCPEIFKTSIAGETMAVLCGPAGNKFLFSSDPKLIKPWWPEAVSEALLFKSSYTSPLLEENSFLRLDSMKDYVSIMDTMARDHLMINWVPYNVVKVHPLAKEFTFALACRLFMDYSDDQVKALAKPFFAVAKGIVSAPLNFPGTPYYAAVKGGAVIKKKIVEIIRQRKTEMTTIGNDVQRSDLLSELIFTSNKDGIYYSEEEIANKIIGYLIASFYTTSSTITFVLSHLADHPRVYEQVLREQLEITRTKEAGEMLNWGDIQKMKYTWNVICESMRLIPPAHGGFKEVLSDISFAGFTIPKGWKAFWTVHSTNKNPKYFHDPEKFEPSRFDGNGTLPFSFVPFGGGPRMCAGREYARIEILVFVHNVVTRWKLKKANPNEKMYYNPEPVPVEGLPICLQPHNI